MEVSLPTDTDGFLSQECPSCNQKFKALFGEGSSEPISFCPYCGYHGQNCWYTDEQVKYVQSVAMSDIVNPELKKMSQELEAHSKGFLKMKLEDELPGKIVHPMEVDDDFDLLYFPCCNETIKASQHEHHFCIICGAEIDMKENALKQVFLSHKGVDKDMVINFKKTLDLLGYSPWLDEDAMPAGTPLERGILQGMKSSCGAVFFITPSFKDEGYLETEINYAIQEWREKKDKFSLITLQFIDVNGDAGVIPDLLKPYVWKTPKTELEALCEIIRALPVLPGIVDWREKINGVVRLSTVKSTATELSIEAKTLLEAAAADDGTIMYNRYLGGEGIEIGSKNLITGKDPRQIALWVGGLEDLQRRRYIKDVGHKGEYFEMTREGYAAADELSET
ncbi:hypothetical protein HRM2_19160 [Desulforapulum autotrophicum HRM2]|uniref:TIR domain-containing protein n=1 Tax=Desulforapulum autotrophicum (strain ATCC 43914 / DSM 3382 / VKM B-1955 / HRM2) TaxID=177437 RepID=C0QC05_DESAH|nr:toll/interleukin-1 receptor domain-containing protein [Desulforapulum autotrophicum]ACN15017.1 hypothetical protein HRM2_19160 [Desulforapulum autotrophicum HRM2]